MFLCIFQIKYVRKQNKQCYTSRGRRIQIIRMNEPFKSETDYNFFFLGEEWVGVIPFPI